MEMVRCGWTLEIFWKYKTGFIDELNVGCEREKEDKDDFKVFGLRNLKNGIVIYWDEEDSEKAMAPHSSTLAWKIPGMAEPGGRPSMGSHRVRHYWSDLAAEMRKTKKEAGLRGRK